MGNKKMNVKHDSHNANKADVNATKEPPESQNTLDFSKQIGIKTRRKLRSQRNPTPGLWFGLGMMGIIGWSVVIPTLLGAALGIWLDSYYQDQHSWTLALLIAGLTLGCFNAWYWVDKEQQMMRDEEDQEKKHHGE